MTRCEEKCKSRWRGEEVGDGCTLFTPNLVMANFLCRAFYQRKHVTHILDRNTIFSRSSVFTLGSQVIALPFPAFSEYLHLQLESGMEVHGRAESGWADWGIGDSTAHFFLTDSPVLFLVVTIVHLQLFLCNTDVRQKRVWLSLLISLNLPAQPVEKIRLSLLHIVSVELRSSFSNPVLSTTHLVHRPRLVLDWSHRSST
jgi:hypothetical protein